MSRSDSPEPPGTFVASVERGLLGAFAELFSDEEPLSVVVALSGGSDSTALLLAMAQIGREHPETIGNLVACHINHGLRGQESDQDQKFCESLCSSLNIPLSVIPLNLGEEWQIDANRPPENMLRELRYSNLLVNAQEQDCDVVVTGHTLDDQAETILFRLLRGTSPAGLIGMRPQRELLENEYIYLVRPMLQLTKLDCQRFLASKQISSRFDSSNDDAYYARNFIRNRLVPLIDEKFPGWQSRIERLRLIVKEQEEFMEAATEAAFDCLIAEEGDKHRFSIERFSLIEPALKRRIIARLMREHDVEPSFERIDAVLKMINERTSSAISLSADCEVRSSDGFLSWSNPEDAEDEEPSAFMRAQETPIRLPEADRQACSNIIAWLDKSLRVEAWRSDGAQVSFPRPDEFEILADLKTVALPLVVRMRRPGDVIQPFGMSEQVKLKKYLHTHKRQANLVPGRERLNVPASHAIVVANSEEVLWVPGIGISEKLRVREKPSHRLILLDLSTGGNVIA